MDGIYFIGVGQALFVAALLLVKENRTNGDRILLTWMLLSAALLVFFYLNFIEATSRLIPLMIVWGCIPLLVAPLLYQYVLALTKPTYRIVTQWPHAIPFVLLVTIFLIYYLFIIKPGQIWIEAGFIQRTGNLPWVIRIYPQFFAVSSFTYPVISLVVLIKHQKQVLNEFSYQESITLKWLRNWVILELAAFIIAYAVIQIGSTEVFDIVWSFRVLAGLITVNIFIVGFFGLRQPIIFPPEQLADEKPKSTTKYKSSNLDEAESGLIQKRLKDIMETDRLYIRQNLGIAELARELSVSKHHLSQVINENLGTNFYDFVNQYRVNEIKVRLEDPQYEHLTMLGIALSCGFSSKSSFNAVFKRLEGKTPSQYRANRSKPINLDASD